MREFVRRLLGTFGSADERTSDLSSYTTVRLPPSTTLPAWREYSCGGRQLGRLGAMRSLLVLLAPRMFLFGCSVVFLAGCEEDMGQDDWLWIENTTGDRVYVQELGKPGDDYLIGVGPGERDLFAHERCDDTELIARSGSTSGPVVATRPQNEGRDCASTWVIRSDD